MIKEKSVQQAGFGMLVVLIWGYLFWAATVLQREYYDGYEYIFSARTLFGESQHFTLKNILHESLLVLVTLAAKALGSEKWLVTYHFWNVSFVFFLLILLARWLSHFTQTSFLLALFLLTCNRIFLENLPTVLSDTLAACIVGFWWYTELEWDFRSANGLWLRVSSMALCALCRVQSVLLPVFSLVWGLIQGRNFRRTFVISISAFVVYVLAAGYFNSYNNPLFFDRGFFPKLGRAIIGVHDFLRMYLGWVRKAPRGSFVEIGQLLFSNSGIIGWILIVLGVFRIREFRTSPKWNRLVGLMVGSGALLCMHVWARVKGELRQYGGLIICFVFLQLLAIRWFDRKSRLFSLVIATGLFLEVFLPVWKEYRLPHYRSTLESETAREIAKWAAGRPIRLMSGGFGPLFSVSDVLHSHSPEYELSTGVMVFEFVTGVRPKPSSCLFRFERFGFPIPDNYETCLTGGEILVIPPMHRDGQITPLRVLRRELNRQGGSILEILDMTRLHLMKTSN